MFTDKPLFGGGGCTAAAFFRASGTAHHSERAKRAKNILTLTRKHFIWLKAKIVGKRCYI